MPLNNGNALHDYFLTIRAKEGGGGRRIPRPKEKLELKLFSKRTR